MVLDRSYHLWHTCRARWWSSLQRGSPPPTSHDEPPPGFSFSNEAPSFTSLQPSRSSVDRCLRQRLQAGRCPVTCSIYRSVLFDNSGAWLCSPPQPTCATCERSNFARISFRSATQKATLPWSNTNLYSAAHARACRSPSWHLARQAHVLILFARLVAGHGCWDCRLLA